MRFKTVEVNVIFFTETFQYLNLVFMENRLIAYGSSRIVDTVIKP